MNIDLNGYIPVYFEPKKIKNFEVFIGKIKKELTKNKTTIEAVANDVEFWKKIFMVDSTTRYPKIKYDINKVFADELSLILGIKLAIPAHEECCRTALSTPNYYFRSIYHFIDCIDALGRMVVPNYSSGTMFLTYKCWAISAWYGLSTEEALDLKAEHLIQDCNAFYIETKRKKIRIQQRLYNLMVTSSAATEDYTLSGHRKYYNAGNTYVFKASGAGRTKTTINKFTTSIQGLNKKLSEVFGKVFDYQAMARCKLYNDIHNDRRDVVFTEKVRAHFHSIEVLDSARIARIRQQYRKWLEMYYPDETI